MENEKKDIIKGVVITTLIFVIPLYLPFLGLFCPLFIPLPILYYRLKLGRKISAWVPIITSAAMVMLMGSLSLALLFFMELMILGFILAECFEMNLSIEKAVLYTASIVTAIGIAGLSIYGSFLGTGVSELISKNMTQSLEAARMILYENQGETLHDIHEVLGLLEQLRQLILEIIPFLPGMAICSILFLCWTTLLMARPLLKNKGLFCPEFGSLTLWKAPEYLVWGVIGCGIACFLPSENLSVLGINGLLILMIIYFFGGIAIVSFYFEKKRFPFLLRSVLYSLIFLQVICFLVIGLGFFDMWLNFRKLEEVQK